MPRRILVTGASGFVGRALCRTLIEHGSNVLAAVRDAQAGSDLPCPCIGVGEIGPGTDWRAAIENVDAIVHLAARTHVISDRAADPLRAYRKVNVEGTVQLAEQAAKAGIRRFVFLSSVKVNGEQTEDHAFSESDEPQPCDAYGISKLEAERQLASICARAAMESAVLRPPLVYGPGVKGNLLALVRAIDRGLPLPLGSIRNSRTLLGIDNLVCAIMLCLHHPSAAGSTFLVGDERPISSPQLARAIAEALGRKCRLLAVPVALMRFAGTLFGRQDAVARLTSSLVVDSSRIRERLGWRPVRSFEEGIADMVHRYQVQSR